jgi:hypothetical protein
MEVLEEPQCSGVELLLLLARAEPDVLVLQQENSVIPGLSQVFSEYPHLTVLTLSPDGLEITLHHLKAQSRALSASAAERVVHAVRTALRSDLWDQ